MTVAVSSPTHIYFQTRRPIQIGGEQVERGTVIDLAQYNLPPGRVDQLVSARLGELVSIDDESIVRQRIIAPPKVEAPDVQPPDNSGDVEGVTPLGEWTEDYLMGLGAAGQKALCRSFDIAVRGTLSDRTDRLLLHQQENPNGKP